MRKNIFKYNKKNIKQFIAVFILMVCALITVNFPFALASSIAELENDFLEQELIKQELVAEESSEARSLNLSKTTEKSLKQNNNIEQSKSINIIKKTYIAQIFDLPSADKYGDLPTPSGESAQAQFTTTVDGLLYSFRLIIGTVAIVMIVYAGFRMVTGGGKEDTYREARRSILYGIIGLAAVGLAGEIPKILDLTPGQTFLQDPNRILRSSVLFNQRTQIIITFIKYFIGSVAVIMIIRNGMRMITMGESEDKISLDKKNLMYSVIGLILVILSDSVINNVFYKVDLTRYPSASGVEPKIDVKQGVAEIVGFTNFIVSLVAPIAVIVLLAGGVMYITAGGEEEKMNKAKRMMMTAVVGIILIYGAFALVSTFIGGMF